MYYIKFDASMDGLYSNFNGNKAINCSIKLIPEFKYIRGKLDKINQDYRKFEFNWLGKSLSMTITKTNNNE